MRRVGGGTVEREVGVVRGGDGPVLSLRHVVDPEEGELVGLAEHARVAVPRSAALGVELHAARMGETAHRAVEAVAEEVVAHAAVVGEQTGARPRAHEARECGQVGQEVVAGAGTEGVREIARPRGDRPFPAHGIDVRKGGAHERAERVEERTRDAVEVPLHGGCVDHVHVVLALGDRAIPEPERVPLAVPFRRAGSPVERRHVGHARVLLPAVHHAARVAPAGLHARARRDAHGERGDVVVVFEVWRRIAHIHAHHEALGTVLAREPRPLQRTAAVAQVHRELQAEPGAFLHRIDDEPAPFVAAERHFRFGLPHDLVVAARVEEQDAAETGLLHRLEVGGRSLLVDVAVHPVPVAPGTRGAWRRTEGVIQRIAVQGRCST